MSLSLHSGLPPKSLGLSSARNQTPTAQNLGQGCKGGRRAIEEIISQEEARYRLPGRSNARVEAGSFQIGKAEHRRHPVSRLLVEALPLRVRRCVNLDALYCGGCGIDRKGIATRQAYRQRTHGQQHHGCEQISWASVVQMATIQLQFSLLYEKNIFKVHFGLGSRQNWSFVRVLRCKIGHRLRGPTGDAPNRLRTVCRNRDARLLRSGGAQPLVHSSLRRILHARLCLRLSTGSLALRTRGSHLVCSRNSPLVGSVTREVSHSRPSVSAFPSAVPPASLGQYSRR